MKSILGATEGGTSDPVTVLLLAAKADREFGDRLRLILRLPSFHRKSMINTALNEMHLKGEPPTLIQAIALLADDASAARMLEYLSE